MEILDRELHEDLYIGDRFEQDLDSFFDRKKIQSKKIILFTGESFFKNSKYYSKFVEKLDSYDNQVVEELQISPNPEEETVDQAVDKAEFDEDDTVVFSVGGGSVIDSAKLATKKSGGDVEHYVLPTRIGSGAAFSPFIIFDNEEFKIGEFDPDIKPEAVYVNSEIIAELPESYIIEGLADIFNHAFESKYSEAGSERSDELAEQVLKKLDGKDFLELDPNELVELELKAIKSESEGLVLFPHAAGHYVTYKQGISHPVANLIFTNTYISYLEDKNINVSDREKKLADELVEQLQIKELDIVLDEEEAPEACRLVQKYMPFVFENDPAELDEEVFVNLFKNGGRS